MSNGDYNWDYARQTLANISLSNVVLGSAGTVGAATAVYTTGSYSSYGSAGYNFGSTVNITSDDIEIKGRRLLKTLDAISDRLAILEEPSLERLNKYAALKDAYDKYKMLEALINDDGKPEQK
jgi:hypothetical protein